MPDIAAISDSVTHRDAGLLWHPYAPLHGNPPYAVEGADGVRLRLRAADGTGYEAVDAMASWWCAIHGYRNPRLDAAAAAQLERFSHVMFGGLTHEPAVALAEQLVDITPGPMAHVFFADSGSVSVEVALKLAAQYQAARGRPTRQRILAPRGGYHGDTFAAMSVCDPVDGMHSAFPGLVADQLFVPRPPPARHTEKGWEYDEAAAASWCGQLSAVAREHADEVAAIIVEPVLQGAGGMYVYPPACLRAMRAVADELDVLLIADEIATGFGRTGAMFACDWADVVPDVMCVGKALTGGYLTLAAVLMTERVGSAISGSEYGALLHGPTFMANPLACAIAGESVRMVREGGLGHVGRTGAGLAAGLAPLAALSVVHDVRTLGAVGVVQLDRPVDVPAVTAAALRRGVWVRPFRDLVYTMPPYVSTTADISAICSAVGGAIEEVYGS